MAAFNTILLQVPDSTCRWITDFQSNQKQHVKLGKHVSESQTISTGSPQGCILSPLLFSPYTNSCTTSHQSVMLLKFVDNTALIGLFSGRDVSACRWEIDHLMTWCSQNNLELKAPKTVEIVVDFRKNPAPPAPIILCGSPVNSVESCRFLGTINTQDLKWELNIRSLTKKAQQRMFFLQQLRKFNLPVTMMVHFCIAIFESILTSSITVQCCSVSYALLRRCLAATFHPFRTCTAPGLWGMQVGLWPTAAVPVTDFLTLSPLAGGCSQDKNLLPHEQFLPCCSWDP